MLSDHSLQVVQVYHMNTSDNMCRVDPWGSYHFFGKCFFFRSICQYGPENTFGEKKLGPSYKKFRDRGHF